MSHVGFADHYEPPAPDFDADAAYDDGDRATKLYALAAIEDATRYAKEWDENYGHNDGKVGACEMNPWLEFLRAAYDMADYFYPERREDFKRERQRLGV